MQNKACRNFKLVYSYTSCDMWFIPSDYTRQSYAFLSIKKKLAHAERKHAHTLSIMAPLYNSNNRTMLPLYRYLYPFHYADFTPHL